MKLSERLRQGILRWPDGGLKYNDAANVMEQAANLLDECERAFVRVLDYSSDPHLVNLADRMIVKLRAAQEKADETK